MITDKKRLIMGRFFCCRLRSSVFGLQSSVFSLQSSGSGLQAPGSGLQSPVFGPASSASSQAACQPASHQTASGLRLRSSASGIVFGIRSPASGLRSASSGLPAACQRPASGTPKVLHPHGVVVVVAHPPLGLYIRIF